MKQRAAILSVCIVIAIAFILFSFNGTNKIRAQGQGSPSPASFDFIAVDSVGKPIGVVLGPPFGNDSTVMNFKGRWLPISLNRDRFVWGSSPDLVFTTSNCTG